MAWLDVAAKERLAALCQLKEIPVLWDEPMKNHTSFKIGGPAAALCAPKDRRQLRELRRVHRLPRPAAEIVNPKCSR